MTVTGVRVRVPPRPEKTQGPDIPTDRVTGARRSGLTRESERHLFLCEACRADVRLRRAWKSSPGASDSTNGPGRRAFVARVLAPSARSAGAGLPARRVSRPRRPCSSSSSRAPAARSPRPPSPASNRPTPSSTGLPTSTPSFPTKGQPRGRGSRVTLRENRYSTASEARTRADYTPSMPLQLTTAGESHGPRLTAILEGIPAGLRIDLAIVDRELARRQHGYGRGGRMKIERDEAVFEGGVRGGVTLGSPIAIGVANRDYASWEKVMGPLRGGRGRGGREAADDAPPRPRGPGRRNEVRRAGPARRPRARLGAGVGGARGRRRRLQAAALGMRHRGRERGPLGRRAPWTRRRRAPSPRSGACATTRRCAPSMPGSRSGWSPRSTRRRPAGETLGGSILVGARGVPAGLGLLRLLGPEARRPHRPGAALGAGGQGDRVRHRPRGLARPRFARPRRDREGAGRGRCAAGRTAPAASRRE